MRNRMKTSDEIGKNNEYLKITEIPKFRKIAII